MKKLLFFLAITFSTASYSQLTDANIQTAVDLWVSDSAAATTTYGNISNWNVSQVTDMSGLFRVTSFNDDISAWDVSSVTDMSGMFAFATSFNQDIGDWEVGNVEYMDGMFDAASAFNQNIGDWDVSSVTDMSGMFAFATSFNQDIGSWEVGNVEYMENMFDAASTFNQNIGDWDVSNVTDINDMFAFATSFNQDIGDWEVGNVEYMDGMFYSASAFNQDISNWCVTNIASEPSDFSTDSPLSESNKPVWGTCPTAGIDDQSQLDISIYPNPTLDMVYIEGNYTQLKVVVYDILGKQVMKESISNSIDISHLDNGIYILQLSDGVKLTTQRIIKN
jgi:surface protein